MSRMTPAQYQEYLLRQSAKKFSGMLTEHEPCIQEVGRGGLHEQIIKFCDDQWPRWKYIHQRTDKRSTTESGVHDFTIYASNGRIFNIECKAKGKKQTTDQTIWAKELEMLGHKVLVVYSREEFLEVIK